MDNKEFAIIVEQSKPVVLSAVRKYLNPDYYHALDDVVQEIYIRAYKGITGNKFRGDSALNTWLYSIARNESLRMNDKLNRDRKRKSGLVSEEIPYYDKSQEALGLRLEMERLTSLLRKLPEKYRNVLELYIAGRSEIEISNNLNIKKGTVKSRISRGKAIIREAAREVEAGL
jgi:RNA polymerase sigma-70 factor (ECF subfamily)